MPEAPDADRPDADRPGTAEPAALPAGTRLLHIGPHKTGTTTVQSALHENRAALARQGVHYAGRKKHSMTAAMTAAGLGDLPTQASGAGRDRWTELVAEVRAADARATVISSEFYCEADEEHIRAILDALDPARTHVLVTLRPLVRILASQWQQYMQNRMTISYPDWLDAILNHPERGVTPTFWNRHRHDRVIRRWAQVAGTDDVTVVVVDDSDKTMLMRIFEGLLGLEAGTMVPADVGSNRSLTWPEVELMRTFNQAWRDAGLGAEDYTRLVRFGAARHLQERRPGAAEERLLTPQWAIDRTLQIGAEMAEEIAGLGVRVIGDLGLLSDPATAPAAGENAPAQVPAALGGRLLAGLLRSIDEVPGRPAESTRVVGPVEAGARRLHAAARPAAEKVGLGEVPGRELLAALRARIARRPH